MDQFDPYHKWLGIPSAEQPPNHYRLLGITLFEADPEVIEAAADRQMKYVSQCATGNYLALSQKLLNELSTARVCLLVPARKQAYDADLKANLNEAQRIEYSMIPVPLSEPTPNVSETVPPVTAVQVRRSQPKKRQPPKSPQTTAAAVRQKRPPGMILGISAILLCAIGLPFLSGWLGTSKGQPVHPIPSESVHSQTPIAEPQTSDAPPVHEQPRLDPRAQMALDNARPPLAPTDAQNLLETLIQIANEAVTNENPGSAAEVMTAAAIRFRDLNCKVQQEDAEFLARQFMEIRDAFALARNARDKLQTNPDDPAANLAWGLFVCFYKQDWASGLPLLAKSNDPVWEPLALRELARPTTDDEWLAHGDAWYDAGVAKSHRIRILTSLQADKAWQQALAITTAARLQDIEQQVNLRTIKLFGDSFVVTTERSMGATVAASEPYSPTDAFTIEFWVSTRFNGPLLSKRIGGDPSFILHLPNGVPNLSVAIGGGERGSGGGAAINDGNWHHLALVKRGQTATLFVDGRQTVQTDEPTNMDSADPWRLGISHNRPSLAGRFGGIRISKTVRYDGPFTPAKVHLKDKDTLLPK
ncbi:MAG: LamG domain-containing protein [Planctomycetes bacterium]|nr:LamG domain-containing protein [Planctomycetota bacterium]